MIYGPGLSTDKSSIRPILIFFVLFLVPSLSSSLISPSHKWSHGDGRLCILPSRRRQLSIAIAIQMMERYVRRVVQFTHQFVTATLFALFFSLFFSDLDRDERWGRRSPTHRMVKEARKGAFNERGDDGGHAIPSIWWDGAAPKFHQIFAGWLPRPRVTLDQTLWKKWRPRSIHPSTSNQHTPRVSTCWCLESFFFPSFHCQ